MKVILELNVDFVIDRVDAQIITKLSGCMSYVVCHLENLKIHLLYYFEFYIFITVSWVSDNYLNDIRWYHTMS